MYSTCLYCNNALGSNEVVETFPVGRRLAFDQAKGRLWVVCRKCEKWNLSPLEERWEAIETCERMFHDARKRVSTDNIGLAKLTEGLELVRIGAPMRPEFAAWRYGDQFGRRRTRAIAMGVGATVVGGGVIIAGISAGILSGGGWAVYQGMNGLVELARKKRRLALVTAPNGQKLLVRGEDGDKTSIVLGDPHSEGWSLDLHHKGGRIRLEGEHARRATALIMPKVNVGGASRDKVHTAVQRIESSGDPAKFLQWLALNPPLSDPGYWGRKNKVPLHGLSKLPLETRLAVEMAVNEENERRVLEGELMLLELEWKEAEEIAGIADHLGNESVEEQFQALKRGTAGTRDRGQTPNSDPGV
jgi:hypothetical protein